MNIKSDLENQFFRRHEVVMELESPKTPTFAEMQVQVAEKMKADSGLVVIRSIKGGFGNSSFRVEAFIYSKAEDKTKFEPKVKLKKEAGAAAPAGGKK